MDMEFINFLFKIKRNQLLELIEKNIAVISPE